MIYFSGLPLILPRIDIRVVCHCIAINSAIKLVVQRKYKVSEEKQVVIDEEVVKLKEVGFIVEIKYSTWLVNVALVHIFSQRWRVCAYFIYMNMTYP